MGEKGDVFLGMGGTWFGSKRKIPFPISSLISNGAMAVAWEWGGVVEIRGLRRFHSNFSLYIKLPSLC